MDCLAAGARHSFSTCEKVKQPLLDIRGKRTQASLLHHHSNAPNKSYIPSFSGSRRLVRSSRALTLNASCNISSKASEIQVRALRSQNADLNEAELKQRGTASSVRLTSREPDDVDSLAISQQHRSNSASNKGAAKLASSYSHERALKENGNAWDAKLTSDRKDGKDGAHRSCAGQINSEACKPAESNNPNGSVSPSVPLLDSEDKSSISSGPLQEMHSRVSRSNESQVYGDPDPLSRLLASRNIVEFIIRFPGWADAQKEVGMPQRQQRAFYSHEDWLQHRSSLRYVRHVLSSISSRVIVSLVPPVFTFTAGAIGVATYNTALKFSLFPSFFPLLHAASLPYELLAPALALLLVFRTDASYSRYDEARKTWTSVISTTKDLARQSAQLIKSSQDAAIKSSFLSYIMAFPVSLKCHLIHGSDTTKDLQCLLQDDDLAFVLASQHKPNCLIQLMSQSLGLLHIENSERNLLENYIAQYNASVSTCERLIRTPIPLSYTRLTSRFLVLWHMSLPIVLWDACNWLVVPATFFSASTLFCIEEVGVLIEEPFPMLALDKIIGVAHDNIRESLKRQQETDHFLSRKRSHQTTYINSQN